MKTLFISWRMILHLQKKKNTKPKKPTTQQNSVNIWKGKEIHIPVKYFAACIAWDAAAQQKQPSVFKHKGRDKQVCVSLNLYFPSMMLMWGLRQSRAHRMPKDVSGRWMHVWKMDSSGPGVSFCRAGDVLGRGFAAGGGFLPELVSTL